MAIEEGFAKVEEMAYRYSNEVKAEIELPSTLPGLWLKLLRQ